VVSSLQYHEDLSINQVHKTVFLGDPPRPSARQRVPQLLGLPDAGVWVG
jgi:hypothetical protein